MTEIKTTLKELQTGFQESANDEDLPLPERRFAARLCVLTAHVEQLDVNMRLLAANAQSADKLLAGRLNDMRGVIAKLVAGEAPNAPAAEVKPSQSQGADVKPATTDAKPEPAEAEVVDDEEAALAKFLAESEAEERAALAASRKSAANKGKNIVPIKAEVLPAAKDEGAAS